MQFRKRARKEIRLDITPLVDVVFLLLIFFMVSTTFISNPGIKLQLPLASAKSTLEKKPLEVIVTKENLLFIDGTPILFKDLSPVLTQKVSQSKDLTLVIKADGRVEHRVVVNVLDLAKQAGIHKLSIAIEPKKER